MFVRSNTKNASLYCQMHLYDSWLIIHVYVFHSCTYVYLFTFENKIWTVYTMYIGKLFNSYAKCTKWNYVMFKISKIKVMNIFYIEQIKTLNWYCCLEIWTSLSRYICFWSTSIWIAVYLSHNFSMFAKKKKKKKKVKVHHHSPNGEGVVLQVQQTKKQTNKETNKQTNKQPNKQTNTLLQYENQKYLDLLCVTVRYINYFVFQLIVLLSCSEKVRSNQNW